MARSFNGSSDFLNTGSLSLSGVSQLTISLWLNWTTFALNDDLALEYSTNANNNTGAFYIDPNSGNNGGTVSIGWDPNSGVGTVQAFFTRPSAGVWHNYVFQIDGTQTANASQLPVAYVDGVSQSLSRTGVNANTSNLGNFALYFMSRAGSSLFGTGSIADVALWSTLLSSGNVTSLFNGVRPVNVNSANLVGWWPIDGYASPETDLSSGGNNATVTGTARVLGPPALWRISG